ncbi:hypothetical protein GCM10010116_05220 [Microbispora rosea subsp. aerata]|nr:hypothetical protein GCM10010116_05220 [Microbispora rosea subsp. aerata]GIH54577.1 hypothetical protein Mro02_14910 [Microbispora rosea subsp. aerata]
MLRDDAAGADAGFAPARRTRGCHRGAEGRDGPAPAGRLAGVVTSVRPAAALASAGRGAAAAAPRRAAGGVVASGIGRPDRAGGPRRAVLARRPSRGARAPPVAARTLATASPAGTPAAGTRVPAAVSHRSVPSFWACCCDIALLPASMNFGADVS